MTLGLIPATAIKVYGKIAAGVSGPGENFRDIPYNIPNQYFIYCSCF